MSQSGPSSAETQLVSISAYDPPGDVYSAFNDFAEEHFGAETDDVFYDYFGDSLEFLDEDGHDGVRSTWTYASERSATVTVETNLPATSHVEYRMQGNQSFTQSETTERSFSVHIHHLTGLDPGTTYEWRPVAVDERGNEITGETRTIETKPADSLTPLSVDEDSEPAVTIEESGEYVLTEDFTAKRKGIEIHADDVTLDLGGHTVTYATIEVDPDERYDNEWEPAGKGSMGVWAWGHSNLTVVNGTVKQAETDPEENRGNVESVGYNPAMIRSCNNVEVAGIEADHHSPQNTGMRFRYPGDDHHVHHNLLARVRQNGIEGHTAFNNEIYGDSWATNSFLIMPSNGDTPDADGYYNNRIYATGYNAYGFCWAKNKNASGENVKALYDDIYFATGDDSNARVELTDSTYYGASTRMQLCDVRSWSPNRVSARLRKGSLDSIENAAIHLTTAEERQAVSMEVS